MSLRLLVLLLLIAFACSQTLASDQRKTNESQNSFLYFAYGSNMLTKRIHKNVPSAELVSIARLKDHRLDFIEYDLFWHGCSSTIVPSEGAETWGVVWRMNPSDVEYLDKQEMVHAGWYSAKNVIVRAVDGEDLECRTYQKTHLPDGYVSPSELPLERQPSPAYLNTIIGGAKEHDIPLYYVNFLRSFRHNGYQRFVDYH